MALMLTVQSPIDQIFYEPLTLAEVKAFLRVPTLSPTDSEDDALIENLISAARETAEIIQGRDLIRKQWDKTLGWFPPCIELRDPLVTVDLVKYRDSDGTWHTLVENTDYIVDTSKNPGIIMPPYGVAWPSFTPWPTSSVLVRFTSGFSDDDNFWSDAGMRVLAGMRMLISHWYNNRAPFFQIGGSGIQELPYAVTALLSMGALPRAF